jgi:hypothetical protein
MRFSCYVAFSFLLVTSAVGQNRQSTTARAPKGGYVPDAVTASRVAEAVLIPVYGEQRIASERPFTQRCGVMCGPWKVR